MIKLWLIIQNIVSSYYKCEIEYDNVPRETYWIKLRTVKSLRENLVKNSF